MGYEGTSCEECAFGYTRVNLGRYLGTCEPCNCNGHSKFCHPKTGVCQNCLHDTTGDYCEMCLPGYEGDATRGTPDDCYRAVPRCDCDRRGSLSSDCPGGQCRCKENVVGRKCDSCAPETFNLRSEDPLGCTPCFCGGVSPIDCSSSMFYRSSIPLQIANDRHGVILRGLYRDDTSVAQGFAVNPTRNEISYSFRSEPTTLYWSLPSDFAGNLLTSYGGNLTWTQGVKLRRGQVARPEVEAEVRISGNGIDLLWVSRDEPKNLNDIRTEETFRVALLPNGWKRSDGQKYIDASRIDFLSALHDVTMIQIRAILAPSTEEVSIRNVVLDTAIPQFTGREVAVDVESCKCPYGYSGLSCESCAQGHYRDLRDLASSVFGSCKPCPCNGREESCSADSRGQVICTCKPQYTGSYCEESGE
ncbi:unnamed protein product, partial [Notodromas monacha]